MTRHGNVRAKKCSVINCEITTANISINKIILYIKFINKCNEEDIGYEPADLTVHPPPKQSRVGSFFSHRCLVPPKFFPQRKSGFCRRLERIRTHTTVVLRHNHSNPISTRLTLFDNIE